MQISTFEICTIMAKKIKIYSIYQQSYRTLQRKWKSLTYDGISTFQCYKKLS